VPAALDACEGMGVNVEIRTPRRRRLRRDGASAVTVAALQARDGASPILVSCFDITTLARVRALDPSIATALLTFALDDVRAVIDDAAAAGHRALHPFDATVDAALVDAAHVAGLVNVWTVDDPLACRAADLGVDGICTNVPDRQYVLAPPFSQRRSGARVIGRGTRPIREAT
jgi:glycerophosphoryl diester phosphodiesterase